MIICYCLAREQAIMHEKTKLQARTFINVWFWGQFVCPDIFVIGHNTFNTPEIFQVFTVFRVAL